MTPTGANIVARFAWEMMSPMEIEEHLHLAVQGLHFEAKVPLALKKYWAVYGGKLEGLELY